MTDSTKALIVAVVMACTALFLAHRHDAEWAAIGIAVALGWVWIAYDLRSR